MDVGGAGAADAAVAVAIAVAAIVVAVVAAADYWSLGSWSIHGFPASDHPMTVEKLHAEARPVGPAPTNPLALVSGPP